MPIITVMANPKEFQRNIRKIAAEKRIAPPGYEETIYLEKGADGGFCFDAPTVGHQVEQMMSLRSMV